MRFWIPICVLLSIALCTTPTWAAACSGCPSPSASTIVQAANVPLLERKGMFGPRLDYLEMDAGDCEFRVETDDAAEMVDSYLVLRGGGEVWNCPDSKSSSTISASVTKEDASEWSASREGSGGLSLDFLSIGVSTTNKQGGSHGIRETADLSMTIQAQFCYRIPWLAYLRVGHFELEITVTSVQPWAWWTKNVYTGANVHQSGGYEQVCESAKATLKRTAPVLWHIHRAQYGCVGCAGVVPKDLGWAPPTPKTSPPPPVPPEFVWPKADGGPGDQEDDPKPVSPPPTPVGPSPVGPVPGEPTPVLPEPARPTPVGPEPGNPAPKDPRAPDPEDDDDAPKPILPGAGDGSAGGSQGG